MSKDEIQLEYCKRQFEWFKAMFYLSLARMQSAQSDMYKKEMEHAANSYQNYMNESNNTIYTLLEKMNPFRK